MHMQTWPFMILDPGTPCIMLMSFLSFLSSSQSYLSHDHIFSDSWIVGNLQAYGKLTGSYVQAHFRAHSSLILISLNLFFLSADRTRLMTWIRNLGLLELIWSVWLATGYSGDVSPSYPLMQAHLVPTILFLSALDAGRELLGPSSRLCSFCACGGCLILNAHLVPTY